MRRPIFLGGALSLAALTLSAAAQEGPQARAVLHNSAGERVGEAFFTEVSEGVRIRVTLEGFVQAAGGERGIHLHETGACEPDFAAAGDHFNPEGLEHGFENPHGPHAGDLPNIEVDGEGNATYEVVSERVTLGEEAGRSLLAGDGTALLIHENRDDGVTDPSGNSGDPIACGVVAASGEAGAAETFEGQAFTAQSTTFVPETVLPTEARIQGLELPDGFVLNVFAEGLEHPRMMIQGEDGTVYLTQRDVGEVTALRDTDGDGAADEIQTVAEGLDYVHGLTVYEGQLYLATDTDLLRAQILEDGTLGEPETLLSDLPDAGQHPNRTLAVGPDGMLYLTVGSTCNACLEPNPESATLLRVRPDGSEREVFATGLRNTIGFGWHPETGVLWGMDHGSDARGDDEPPEELNRLEAGLNYGWPFCYADRQPDDYFWATPTGATKAEYCALTEAPALTYQAHSAPIGMTYYTGSQFPEDYRNDAFIAMRGSWNRHPAVGYKVVRLTFDERGEPTGFEDFLTGFLLPDGASHMGRLAGVVELQDGSLLVSEDTNGMIYRVSYEGE